MGSGDNIYDRSKAPKEGVSSISARTRQRLYGRPEPQNFSDWYAQQQRGPSQGPVRTDQPATKQNDFYTGNAPTLTPDSQQQLLENMFKPEQQVGGQGSDRQLQMWLDFKREQMANDINQNPAKMLQAYQAQAQAQDPVRYAQQQRQAELETSPWAKGGLFEGRRAADRMSPEAILASQGNTAENQWAQLGANKNIDPEELQRLNAAQAGRFRTYM